MTIKEGSKGPMVCDFACLRIIEARGGLPGDQLWLVIRRNLSDPTQVKYYLCNSPADLPIAQLVRLSGLRSPVDNSSRKAKKKSASTTTNCAVGLVGTTI